MSDAPFDCSLTPHWQRGYRFQFEPAQKGHVLLYPEGMIKLNESAGLIGELVDGQRPVTEIIQALQARFPDVPELANDVVEFMQVARHKHWITLD